MPEKINEARQAWKNQIGQYKKRQKTRLAWTGDGNGTDASNFYWGPDQRYIWVREFSNPERPFPVFNGGRVRPAVNVPVVLGYEEDIDPGLEKVLGVFNQAIPGSSSSGTSYEIGNHHEQHEWDGGDVVYIDGRQMLPGLVYPTDPPSLALRVKPFVYYGPDGWNRYAGGTSDSASVYLPASGYARGVLLVFDIKDEVLKLVAGDETSTATSVQGDDVYTFISADGVTSWFAIMPDPGPYHLVLAGIPLESDTSALNWDSVDNLIDLRRHVDVHEQARVKGDIRVSEDGKTFTSAMPLMCDILGGPIIDKQAGQLYA